MAANHLAKVQVQCLVGGVANLSQLSAEAKRGYAIYNGAEQACSSCHGAQGQGTPSAAPNPINSTKLVQFVEILRILTFITS